LAQIPPEWFERSRHRFPKAQTEREALAELLGTDGRRLLTAVDEPMAPAWLAELPAVETVRRVGVQQFFEEEGHGRWRRTDTIPPPCLLMASPSDPDAHLGVKRDQAWIGSQVQLTETCDDDAPHLIGPAEPTAATTPDWVMTEPLQRALAARETPSLDGG
jgi:transposase